MYSAVRRMGKTPQHDNIVNPEYQAVREAILADTSTTIEPKTRQEFIGNLDRLFRIVNKPFEETAYRDYDAAFQKIASKVSLGTLNNYKVAAKWLLNEASRVIYAEDEVKAARFRGIADRIVLASSGDIAADQETQKTTVTLAQYTAILDACKDDFHKLLTRLLWETIRRPNEVLGIRWPDVDFEASKIRFPKTKTKALGWSAISPALVADLRAWKQTQERGEAGIETRPGRVRGLAPSEYVFSYGGVKPPTVSNMGRWFRNITARVGIRAPKGQKVSLHCFRGSGAVYLRRVKHWSLEDVQRQGGWANTEQLVKAYFHDEVDQRVALLRDEPLPVAKRATPAAAPAAATVDYAAIAKLVELEVLSREEARARLGA